MAIDTRTKRQAAAGVPLPWAPAVLPSAVDSAVTRAAAGSGYFFSANTITLTPFTNTRVMGDVALIQVASSAAGSTVRPFSFFIAGVDRSELVGTEIAPQISAQVNSKYT